MNRLYTFILLMLVCALSIGDAHAAFPVKKKSTSASTIVDSTTSEQYSRETSYIGDQNQQKPLDKRFKRPYRNRESEARLSYTFGMLGFYLIPPLAIPALILGIISADRRNKYYHKAVKGIVLGAVGIAFILVLIAAVILAG